MTLVTIDHVQDAVASVAPLSVKTPLIAANWASRLWLKAENLQPIGAFKIRGAANAIAHLAGDRTGVITHSSGNHGRALGYVAARNGLDCVVIVPDTAPDNKVAAIRDTGAELITVPAAERETATAAIAKQRGLVTIPPFDHPDVIAGQGTIGLEILTDMPDVDTVAVPVGGGGLASGVGLTVKSLAPRVRVIGVEPALAADAADSLANGRRISWSQADRYRTIADGVRTGLSDLTFAHIQRYVDEIVTVSEDQIRQEVAILAKSAKLVCETSAVLASAAYTQHGEHWGNTVAVVSGGNIAPQLLAELVSSTAITASD